MENNTKEALLEILEERLSALNIAKNEVSSDQSLMEQGILDSLSFLEFIVTVEEKFNTELDLSELDPTEFDSLDKLSAIIENGN